MWTQRVPPGSRILGEPHRGYAVPDRIAVGRTLLALLLFGVGGTLVELLLLEHWDGWKQWVPLTLLGLGLLVLGWALVRSRTRAPIGVRPLMLLYVVSGVVGTWFHYSGNAEFELEMTPDAHGWSLFKEAVTGATPALAPGTMVWFGLLGLIAWKLLSTDRSSVIHPE